MWWTALVLAQPVYMPAMTTDEVEQALQDGATTVLIPTGGIEANGPWLTLDKHDRIAREVAERTARLLGDALVAPVVSFVPEGNFTPPTGHMTKAGTVGVRPRTFDALLRDIAESYRIHGFEHIVFLGDSGGNQQGQEKVAARLDQAWPDVRVHHLAAFYDPSANNRFLEERGLAWTPDEHHDDPGFTLQLLAIDPEAARLEERRRRGILVTDGFSLEPVEERIALGEALLDWRAQRTAEAIRTARGSPAPPLGARVAEVLLYPFVQLVQPTGRFYALYLLTSLLLAGLLVIVRQGRSWNLRSLVAGLFPSDVWRSQDAHADLMWSLFGGLFMFSTLGGATALLVREPLTDGLLRVLSLLPSPGLSPSPLMLGFTTTVSVLATDLGIYLGHLALHKVPLLWTFHKVHHAAERLTPLTAVRQHPVDVVVVGLGIGLVSAPWIALWTWMTGSAPTQLAIAGLNVVTFVFYVTGYHLRHSNIPLSYGPLERVFISPTMHQIHHSAAIEDRDTNLGLIFSFWDGLFGTIRFSRPGEELELGIGPEGARLRTAWAFLWVPIRDALTMRRSD